MFAWPGFLIARRTLGNTSGLTAIETLTVVLGASLFVASAFHFLVAAATLETLRPVVFAGSWAAMMALLRRQIPGSIRFLRRGASDRASDVTQPVWERGVLALSAFAFVLALANFDATREFHFGCTYRPCALASGMLAAEWTGPLNLSLFYQGHQRMGVTAALAPMFSLFGVAGLRFVWGLTMAVIPSAAYAVAVRLGARGSAAFVAAALGAGLPSVVLIHDQNRMLLAMSGMAAVLLFAQRPRRRMVGGVLAILWAAEPMLVLTAPLVSPWVFRQAETWRGRAKVLATTASGFLVVGFPFIVRLLATGSGPWFHEHFAEMPPQLYEFLGFEFSIPAFLNWPLRDVLVRSPYNPIPNLALTPLSIGRHFGLLLLPLPILGALRLALARRWTPLVLGGGYFLALAGFLALNENWTQRDKWDIVCMSYLPLFALAGCGVDFLATRRLRTIRALAYILVFAGCWFAWPALASPRGEFDARYAEYWSRKVQPILPEIPEYMAWERLRIGRRPLLPVVPGLGAPSLRSVRHLVHDLQNPAIDRRLLSVAEAFQHAFLGDVRGGPAPPSWYFREWEQARGSAFSQSVAIDLRTPPHQDLAPSLGSLTRSGACGADAVALHPHGPVTAVRVPWNDTPVHTAAVTGSDESFLAIMVIRSELGEGFPSIPKDVVDADCLLVQGPPNAEIVLFDIVSFDPSREYAYRLERSDPATGTNTFVLLD